MNNILIVTTRPYYEYTKKFTTKFFNISNSDFEKSLIILRWTKVNYKFMVIDKTLYFARGVDFELRFKILLHNIKFWRFK